MEGRLYVELGKIQSVDKERWTCTVKFDDGSFTDHVAISPIYLNEHGNGIYYVPEVGSEVLVAKVKKHRFILSCVYPTTTELGIESIEDQINELQSAPNYSAQRPVLGEGDYSLSTKGGGFIIMRKSGVVEIGASQIARRFYIPIGNFIRDICAYYDLTTVGGNLSFTSRKGLPEHGTVKASMKTNPSDPNDVPVELEFEKTPIEFNLNVKEFAEDEKPIIQLEMGRITSDDGYGDTPTFGSPQSKGYDKDMIFRFSVNEKFNLWIDRYGTIVSNFSGTQSTQYGSDLNVGVKGNHTMGSEGTYKRRSGGDVIEIKGTENRKVKKRSEQIYEDSLKIRVSGNSEYKYGGRQEVVINGYQDVEIGGYSKSISTGDRDIGAGGKLSITSAETIDIISAADQSNICTTGDYTVTCVEGDAKLNVIVGTAKITFFDVSECAASKLNAHVSFFFGGECQVNSTGGSLFTPGGEVSVDLAGNVTLGPSVGIAAPVVTTSSHPVCYVTGLPILGCAEVSARSNKPPSPVHVPCIYTSTS